MIGDFEELLETAGGTGKYQIFVILWFQLTCPTLVSNMGFMVFGGIFPQCSDELNSTLRVPTSLKAASLSNNSFDGNDVNLSSTVFEDTNLTCQSSFHSLVMEWSLHSLNLEWIPALLISIQMAGVFTGPLIAGMVSDRFGRLRVFAAFFLGLLVIGFASAFAPNWESMIAFRFLIGACLGGVMSVQFVYAVESLTAPTRTFLYFGGWPLGYILLGILALLLKHWQYLTIAGNAMGVLPLVLTLFLYESPKWKMDRGDLEGCLEIMTKIAVRNGRNAGEQKMLKMQLEGLVDHGGKRTKDSKTYGYWHLFRNRKASIETLVILGSWSTTALVYYGLVFNTGALAGDPAINTIIFAAGQLVVQVLIPFMDRNIKILTRRVLHQSGLVGMGLCILGLVITGATSLEKTHPHLMTIFSILAMAFCAVIWVVIELYTVELFPTVLRNMGNALCNVFARIGSIIAPQIMLLMLAWPAAPFVVMFGLLLLNSILAYFYLPETKGRPLPSIHD